MPRTAPIITLLLFTAATARAQWQRVQQLPPDTPIAVLERGRTYPTPCHMDWSDDHTLACITANPYAPTRTLVFPQTSVAAVYTEELSDAPGRAPMLIVGALGGFLGGAICRETNPQTILVCVLAGGLAGAGVALSAPSRFPRPPHIVRHRIYTNP